MPNINNLTTIKYTKQDLGDLFLDLRLAAAEYYDNALGDLSFDRDNAELVVPIYMLIRSLPKDFVLEINKEEFENTVAKLHLI